MTHSTAPGIEIKLPLKIISMIVAALVGGGGTFWAIDYYSRAEVDQRIKQSQQTLMDHGHQSSKKLKEKIQKNTEKITNVGSTVARIESVQIKDISRSEARRITEKIKSRQARESAYDRLVDRNYKRLKKGQDPCSTVDCN